MYLYQFPHHIPNDTPKIMLLHLHKGLGLTSENYNLQLFYAQYYKQEL